MLRKVALSLVIIFGFSSVAFAEVSKPLYPNATHQIIIDSDKEQEYSELAEHIGFTLQKKYSYTEYADIKTKNNLGTAGNYDFLLLSTGGNEWDYESYEKFNRQQCGWETTYYGNHDLTVVNDICHDSTRSKSWVRILKVAEGRRPDLHQE